MITALAWRNLWRQPRRSVLSILGIALTAALLVFLVSLDRGVDLAMKANFLGVYDGFAQVQARDYASDFDLHKTLARSSALAADLRRIKAVKAAAPRIVAFAVAATPSRSFGATVLGVDPQQEAGVSRLASTIHQGRYLRPGDDADAVLGDVLARDLKVGVGGDVTLLGSGQDGSVAADRLHIVGVFHSGTGDLDRQLIEMPLARAQQTFAYGDKVNLIALSGRTLPSLEGAMPAIGATAERYGADLADWKVLEPSLRDSIAIKAITSGLFYAVLVLVVVFIVLNTLLMSVLERTREYGMLLALGMRSSLVGATSWLEMVFLALAGTSLGVLLGSALAFWIEQRGIEYPSGGGALLAQFGLPSRIYSSLDLVSAFSAPGAILVAICLGGAAPFLHILRLKAVPAMRSA